MKYAIERILYQTNYFLLIENKTNFVTDAVSIEGAPATGKSTLVGSLSETYTSYPEIPEYAPSEYRQRPRDGGEFTRRAGIETTAVEDRWSEVGSDERVVLDTSVVSSIGLLSLFATRIDTDLSDRVREVVDSVGRTLPSPDHVVCLVAEPSELRRRWRQREGRPSFWSSPAVVQFLSEYYRSLADSSVATVIDTGVADSNEVLGRATAHVAETDPVTPSRLRAALERAAVTERPTLDGAAAPVR